MASVTFDVWQTHICLRRHEVKLQRRFLFILWSLEVLPLLIVIGLDQVAKINQISAPLLFVVFQADGLNFRLAFSL